MRIMGSNAVRHTISVANNEGEFESGVATTYYQLKMPSRWDLRQIYFSFLPILTCLTAFFQVFELIIRITYKNSLVN